MFCKAIHLAYVEMMGQQPLKINLVRKLRNRRKILLKHSCRDDGLAAIKDLSGLKIERLKKNVIKTFKDCGLNITIEANLHTVNYFDVAFDSRKDIYLLNKKPDNPPVYINNCSNHPPTVIK